MDPVVLFKMMLLGYLYGITSERKLAEECSLNLAFRRCLGYDVDEPTPHHAVISQARSRYGQETFERFCERVFAENPVPAEEGEELALAGTTFEAGAGMAVQQAPLPAFPRDGQEKNSSEVAAPFPGRAACHP